MNSQRTFEWKTMYKRIPQKRNIKHYSIPYYATVRCWSKWNMFGFMVILCSNKMKLILLSMLYIAKWLWFSLYVCQLFMQSDSLWHFIIEIVFNRILTDLLHSNISLFWTCSQYTKRISYANENINKFNDIACLWT